MWENLKCLLFIADISFFFDKIYPLPMASPTRWIWIWVNSRSWWWIGRPGVLWFMGSQRVGHDWATELNCTHFPIFQSFMSHSEMGRALTEQVLRIVICLFFTVASWACPSKRGRCDISEYQLIRWVLKLQNDMSVVVNRILQFF